MAEQKHCPTCKAELGSLHETGLEGIKARACPNGHGEFVSLSEAAEGLRQEMAKVEDRMMGRAFNAG